jgi:hypothetical protein
VTPSYLRPLRLRWNSHSEKPFIRLVRLFVDRIFYGNSESADGGLALSTGLVLSLLALPGGFYSIFLLDKYSTLMQWMRGQRNFDPFAAAIPDEYFFIVLSMVLSGVVAVWRWDSIFPDRRDYSNLVPLPISMPAIFFANLTAIVFLATVLALDVNAASAILFPLIAGASENAFGFFVRFLSVHVLVVVLASIFSFFAVFVTVGALMVSLPRAIFRRISLYLRGAILACLAATLTTSFAVPPLLSRLPKTPAKLLPPVWFVALCQSMRGRASPSLASLGRVAWLATTTAVVSAMVIYLVGYRRCFAQIAEAADSLSVDHGTRLRWIFTVLDRAILRNGFQRAGYRFVMKTLLRSEAHGLVLGGFVGLGIVAASQFLFASLSGKQITTGGSPPSEILALPLILSYCIIVGLRFVFDMPAEMRANWVFQIHLDKTRQECIPLARKVILTFVLPWVFAVAVPIYGFLWGWRVAVMQSVFVALWSLLLIEVLLLRFRKIPFTCSYPPFRDSAVVLALSYVLGFVVFVVPTSNLEHWALANPAVMAAWFVIVLLAWYGVSRIHRGDMQIDQELIFEEKAPVAFELLDLGRGS